MIDAQFLSPKTVLFRIENEQMRKRVLRRHFWHIADIPLVVREWCPSMVDSKPDLTMIPLWVDLRQVPDSLFSEKGLRFLGDQIGSTQRLHPKTERCVRLDVARLLVVVNLEKPLANRINLVGMENRIEVSYPWLPSRCSTYEEWGHVEKDCERMKKGAAVEKFVSALLVKETVLLPRTEATVNANGGVDAVVTEEATTGEAVAKEDESAWSLVKKNGRCHSPAQPMVQQEMEQQETPSAFNVLCDVREEGELEPESLENSENQSFEEPLTADSHGTSVRDDAATKSPRQRSHRNRSRSRPQQPASKKDKKQNATTHTSKKASLGKH